MPTYAVESSYPFTQTQKASLAQQFAKLHTAATGSAGFNVQVIFRTLGDHDHYLGGIPMHELKTPLVFAHLQILEGRKHEVKTKIMNEVHQALCQTSNLPKEGVMVYIMEIGVNNSLSFRNEQSLARK